MQEFISELEKMYMSELKIFYTPYFSDSKTMDVFFQQIFQCDWDNRKPRLMLFQVQRFVSLATEIDKIRPARDGLRVLFLKCCMESLAKLSHMKPQEFFKSFATCFSVDGVHYILNNFTLLSIECNETEQIYEESYMLSIDDILAIIKSTRDMVVHEGDYWSLQIFSHEDGYNWLTHIKTAEQFLSKETFENKTHQAFTYHFETTLQYEKFIFYFVEACRNFIRNYIATLSSHSI